jgi:ketosteroid isomerase-like protein
LTKKFEALVDDQAFATKSSRRFTVIKKRNVDLVKDFFRYMSAGRIDDASILIAEKVVWWSPLGTLTKQALLEGVRQLYASRTTSTAMNVRTITAQDNRVAAEVDGQFELRDGRSYDNTYHFLFVIENGRFVSVREHFDTARMKAFLGDEPPIALTN